MAYYIISFEPEQMKLFQKRFSFLEDAVWINEKKNLAPIISSPSGDAFFFVHLTGKRETIDELVLIIRDAMVTAKIIYVVDDVKSPAIKSHQMSPVGGDAYVPLQIEQSNLYALLEGLMPPEINPRGNRLETGDVGTVTISAQKGLIDLKNHPKSQELERIFGEVFVVKKKKATWQDATSLRATPMADELEIPELEVGEDMSDKDQELSLDDLGDLELGTGGETEVEAQEEAGLDFALDDDIGLDLSDGSEIAESAPEDSGMDLDLDDSFSLDDSEPEALEASGDSEEIEDIGFSLDEGDSEEVSLGGDDELSLDEDETPSLDFAVDDGEDVSLDFGSGDDESLDLGGDDDEGLSLSLDEEDSLDLGADIDLSDDAKEKLKEIDAIMDLDASQIGITMDLGQSDDEGEDLGFSLGENDDNSLDLGGESLDSDLDTSLVSDDLDLGNISFSNEEEEEVAAPIPEKKSKTKEAKVAQESREAYDGGMGKELKEISGAYSGEMERMQATISNLRTDREELLAKIQKLEEDKVLQNRQSLTMRAELDEKKIELSIIRKKNNDEIAELKDRMKLFEEKKLILEEKNKIMAVELDKSAHKNKIDVKKVQMRERELEQKLELLKADSESQIRHRDLKILELKRKLDAMEFDIESISVQEKRSVESRFELEDKLDKAIKTLRNAITVLEDESDKSGTLEALKKNIDM
jgi:hypothetical protein